MLVTGPVQFDFLTLLAFIVTVQFNQHYTVKHWLVDLKIIL